MRNIKNSFKKNTRNYPSAIFLLLLCVIVPRITHATVYQPGETLEPDCAPTTLNCGVATFSLNGQNDTAQTLMATSSGVDFSISSAGNVHSFNIPSASLLARGLLTSGDWNIFNNKQNAFGYTPLNPANNLSDVISASTSRTNLGLGTAATQNTGAFLQTVNNLSDLANATTARTNLGLGTLATQNGTFSGSFSGTSSGTNTGDQTNILGNAATVTTNANLTAPITSNGNATSVASQTGTGSTFVMNTSPLLVTPTLGAAVATSVKSSGTAAITFDSNSTGAVNIGTSNNSKIINIGTGTAGNNINIGSNDTNADTIIIGSSLDALSLTSTGFNVTSGGALTGVQSLDTIAFAPTSILFAVNGSIKSTTSSAITLDSGTTGTVNLGTGNNAKTINLGTGNAGNTVNIGSTSGATELNLNAGSSGIFLAGAGAANAGHFALCIDSGTNQLFLGATASTCDPSSERFKHNIANIGLGLDAVNALRPVSYVYNTNNEPTLGFIAEEAATVDDRLVVRDKNGIIQAINPDAFTPILTRAIQQLSKLLDDTASQVKMFAKKITTDELCLTKTNGDEVCINGDQLDALLQNTNNNPPTHATPSPTGETPVETTPTEPEVIAPTVPDSGTTPQEIVNPTQDPPISPTSLEVSP